jgi:hypothetical protein
MILAEGDLDWCKAERQTGRYGSVNIQTGGTPVRSLHDLMADLPEERANFATAPVGRTGRLIVEILETRDSFHVGDHSLEIFPTTPQAGERIVLGQGSLFTYECDGVTSIGLRPLDGRDRLWLNPEMLYRCHNQTVRLRFQELPMTVEAVDAINDSLNAYIDYEQEPELTDKERGLANLRMAYCYAAILLLGADPGLTEHLEASLDSAMDYLTGEPEQVAAEALLDQFTPIT